jgi:hypothetical protein
LTPARSEYSKALLAAVTARRKIFADAREQQTMIFHRHSYGSANFYAAVLLRNFS